MRLIDTHCHIDLEQFDEDRDAVFQRATEAGVSDLLLIAFEPERWTTSLELAEEHANVRIAAGLHPTNANAFSEAVLQQIGDLAERDEVVGIGETGIDLYWDAAALESQQTAFRAQVDLAGQLGMPFVVHQRDAEDEVLEVLESFNRTLNGVLHCFTGDWTYAKRILRLGMHIGLGGAITFKSRTALHDAASHIPMDRIVIETDSPFMAPTPHRGKRNEPAYVRRVAEELATLRDEDPLVIARDTTRNAMNLFPGLGACS